MRPPWGVRKNHCIIVFLDFLWNYCNCIDQFESYFIKWFVACVLLEKKAMLLIIVFFIIRAY